MRAEPVIDGVDITPPAAIQAIFKTRSGKLLMLPDVANKALKIARDPKCTIESFTSVVGRDIKLASDILKIANSVLYNPRTPIINLHKAVVRLGFQECQNLILTSSIAGMVYKASMRQEWIRTVLWWHSLNTGLLATYINRSLRIGFAGEEFTAGIMHDIGRTLFAVVCPDKFSEIDPLSFDESPEMLDREIKAIGTDHRSLGAWFAIQNEIPSPLPELIYYHHQPELAEKDRKLTALIALADHMSNYLQRNGDFESYDPTQNPFLPILSACMEQSIDAHFLEVAVPLMQEAQRDTRLMLEL